MAVLQELDAKLAIVAICSTATIAAKNPIGPKKHFPIDRNININLKELSAHFGPKAGFKT